MAIADAGHRDQLDLMTVPIVSLAKTRRSAPIYFERGGVKVEVSAPAHIGIATIYDLDIVLWCIGQLNAAIDRGEAPPRTIAAPTYDILRGIRRRTSGTEYRRLREALDRLKATTIRTTLRSKGLRGDTFSLIERVQWAEDEKGRPLGIKITVPDWLYSAVYDRRVLALDPRYFDVTSGLGRWLYRLARKQAGDRPDGWRWPISELHERSGVTNGLKQFAYDLRKLAAANPLPEYWLTIYTANSGEQALIAVRRSKLGLGHPGYEAPIRRNKLDPKGLS
jgi:plasmid replication initiation protein